MGKILEVKNLHKKFKDIQAVDDLSFSVNRGDIYGFLGPNGSGKSTSLRMILSLIFPDSGSIEIFGENIPKNSLQALKKVGALVEKPDFYDYLSAFKNLKILLRYCGQKHTDKEIYDILELVGLKGRAHSKVNTFSQGMKQRLGIAQTLIHDPELLILDEPVNGLDPQGIKDIRDLIIKLNRDYGKTLIISSHILKEIEVIANRMLVINNGRAIAEGDVKELINRQFSRLKLEVRFPEIAYKVIVDSKYKESVVEINNLKEIILQIDRDKIPELNRFLVSRNIDVLSIQQLNSLEDFVLNIT